MSDDATDEIFLATTDGTVEIFTQQVNHPNGLALSNDGAYLCIAQMFTSINPMAYDGRVWSLRIENGVPLGEPEVLVDLGSAAANDGLAVDVEGRIYVAAWGTGEIWRIDPMRGERLLVARDMPGVASLAFGRGAFDHQSIYATSTRTGNVWAVPVGTEGAPLHR